MADEKPKDKSNLRDFANRGAQPFSLGTKVLTEDPELAELIKHIAEKGKPITNFKQVIEVLEALGIKLADNTATAQKRAAETGVVDLAAVNAWFLQHWPQPRSCPICQQQRWSIASKFARVPLGPVNSGPRTVMEVARTYPAVLVACQTCGNTVFFNAILMGLLPEGID